MTVSQVTQQKTAPSVANGSYATAKKNDSSSDSEKGDTEDHGYWHNYPYCVFCIFGCEFCERFSYYGMRAILIMYLTRALLYTDEQATVIYHTFIMLCYFTPIIGAIVADGWIGKYKTIFYIGIVYAIGNITMSVSAIPFNDTFNRAGPLAALLLIAFGTGGIKPNVSAFGGDQFTQDQDRQKSSFFSIFYMSINIGSLLSMIITPILRSDVFCFDTNCYCLAFGVPAILMITALVFFMAGTKWYNIIPPGENIIGKLCMCIGVALKGKCFCNNIPEEEKKEHWLDYAEGKYSSDFIQDIKDLMRVIYIFLPLPFYWALYEQQGSTWTLQAGQMDGNEGGIVIQPDQVQVFNPILIIILLPLMEAFFYPCLTKIGVPHRPLQRLGVGMFLTATAFIMAAGLQVVINQSLPTAVPGGMARYKVVNSAPCAVTVQNMALNNGTALEIDYAGATEYVDVASGDTSFLLESNKNFPDCAGIPTSPLHESLNEGNTYIVAVMANPAGSLFLRVFDQAAVERNTLGKSTDWIINALGDTIDVNLKTTGSQEKDPLEFNNITSYGVSAHNDLLTADYYVYLMKEGATSYSSPGKLLATIDSQNGAVYTIVIQRNSSGQVNAVFHTDVSPNDVNIMWQFPQYFVITLGECLFSVTGLSFAYTQSPKTLKAVVTACWLLTDSVGNLIVIIIELLTEDMSQIGQFLLYSGFMYVVLVVFIVMSFFYDYVTPRDEEEDMKAIPVDGKGEAVDVQDHVAFSAALDETLATRL